MAIFLARRVFSTGYGTGRTRVGAPLCARTNACEHNTHELYPLIANVSYKIIFTQKNVCCVFLVKTTDEYKKQTKRLLIIVSMRWKN